MISFADPSGLLALLSVPVLLVLFCLRPMRRRMVSSTTFLWREALAERRHGPGLGRLLRDPSLLLLLVAAVALSLALADPRWVGMTGRSGDQVLVIDVSASMRSPLRDATRFELAMAEVARRVQGKSADSQVLLIASGSRPRLLGGFESDPERLTRMLAELRVTDEAGDPRAALSLALSMVNGRPGARVHFFTDGAFDADPALRALAVEFHTIAGPAPNVAIGGFDIRRRYASSEQFEVMVRISNHADERVEVPVSATLEEVELFQREVSLEARSSETLVLPFQGDPSGVAHARIDIEDALPSDNVAQVVMPAQRPLRVLLFSSGNSVLQQALLALPAVTTRLSEIVESLYANQVAHHDLVVFDGVEPPSLPPGRYLFIDAVPPDAPFERTGRVLDQAVEGRGRSALVRDLDITGLKVASAIRVGFRGEVEPDRVQNLFWSAQTPLALSWLDEQRRVVYLGFDLGVSDFATRAAFPLWFHASVRWLQPLAAPEPATHLRTGQRKRILLPGEQQRLIVVTPDQRYLRVPLTRDDKAPAPRQPAWREVDFDQTALAGVYRYFEGEDRRYFAVNLSDESESDLSSRAELPEAGTQTYEQPPARSETPLWPWLAGLVALLLLLEWWLWGGRRVVA
ncbi:MAG: VWA domain-containing protein [Gammaproteobacteria bacterium]|nr:VWA domain-containing protein [Gammaproteobacteria bacterium]